MLTNIAIDPFILSRIQFAANITFHIMFPSITIGLSWILLFFKIRYNTTKDEAWMQAYFFFTKIFALSFSIGVVSGVTMSFQFGTNWPGFMKSFGDVAGPLLAYEVLTAFFMEATFLGIMLFGYRKVPGWLHTTATFLVSFGTTLSAFWILALNSWMHTPSGIKMVNLSNGQIKAQVTSWFEVIFNPSMPYRLSHMLLASALTSCFLISGLSAYRYLKGDRSKSIIKSLKTSIIISSIIIPIQIYAGHAQGLNTKIHQPSKLAAMEGAFETKKQAPLILFGIPNEKTRKNDYSIEIPYLSSIIVTHSINGEIKGLNDFKHHPSVLPIFFGFRIMVGLGLLMTLISWTGAYYLIRKKYFPKLYLISLVVMTFSGNIATIAGWYVTEIGRQPWLVEGILKAKDALGPVQGSMVLSSLIIYLSIYLILTISYIYTVFYMARTLRDKPYKDSQSSSISQIERNKFLPII